MAPAVPRKLRGFARTFAAAGYQCWLVGGAVRDLLSGRPSDDFDIATDATPEQVQQLFRRTIPTGLRHGTVTVLHHDLPIEVTTFRTDGDYRDGRHPEQVSYAATIEQDLRRRDFTINAIALDLQQRRLVDPHGGRADLDRKLIRAIGDAHERFGEDGLRPLRACRFAAQLGFTIDAPTLAAIGDCLHVVAKVAAERVRVELEKMLLAPTPSVGLELMEQTGLMQLLLPELHRCVGIEQRERHCFDVFTHSLASCDAAPPDLVLRLAALLHDIGKAVTVAHDADGTLTFHNHDRESARLSTGLLERLRFSNAVRERAVHLIAQHMFNYEPSWSDGAVRRFLARVGEAAVADLLALRRADQIGRCRERTVSRNLIEFEDRLQQVREQQAVLTVRDLAIDGTVLMRELDLSPGPVVGVILDQLLETVIDDPSLNQPAKLLEIAGNFHRQRLDN